MDTPKPTPIDHFKHAAAVQAAADEVIKVGEAAAKTAKVFERKPHLTQRLSDNPQLKALRESLPRNKRQNQKITPKPTRQR